MSHTTTAASSRLSFRRLALLLGGLAMFGPFSIDTIFPAFPVMGARLGADKIAIQQTISAYLVAYALMSLVHGPLSDAIGRKRVIIGGLVVFTFASIGCALSQDLTTLLAFRALQGLSSGVGLIVGRAVIRDVLQGEDAQRLMSQVSMIFGIAPAIAPIIGGWILGWSAWPVIFWFLAAFSVVLLLVTWLGLPETHAREARLPLRAKSLVRDYVAICFNPRFQRLAAASAFNFAALWLFIASAPAFVVDYLKLGESDFGWFFIPMIGGMVTGAFVSGRSAGRVSGERLVAIGFGASAVAMTLNFAYTLWTDAPQVPWAVIPISLNAFGIALVFPIVTLAILDMYPRQRGSASSL
ncbi:MAG TPA: multidrug effflux MFS transporter, partial [Lysobacter sp.]|nr:multidrug effflux MFS transporter [Lysobacter sp.]